MIPLEAIKNDTGLFDRAVAQITPTILGGVIDHTVLAPSATKADIERLCAEAGEIGSFVCVNGCRITDVKELRKRSNSRLFIRGIAAVADFPFGAGTTTEKQKSVFSVLEAGADEADTVLNIGKFLDGDHRSVLDELIKVARTVRFAEEQTGQHKILKIIQENCYLPSNMISTAAELTAAAALESGAHMFAKTSTGFGIPKDSQTSVGATLDDVWAMAQTIESFQKRGVHIGIKAAGGVGNGETAVRMMLAGGCFDDNMVLRDNLSGIFRIGASAGKKIVDDFKKRCCS